MKLYFGNGISVITTIMILVLLFFMGYSVFNQSSIVFWGRRSMFLLIYGLGVCCFATARDGLDKTIQSTIDGISEPGIFRLVSVPTIIGCLGALIIIVAACATPIAKSQYARKIWFYIMSCGIMLKIVTIEIARIFVH